jgi:hypothetical protein
MARLAVVFVFVLILLGVGAGSAAVAGAVPIIKDLTPTPLKVWAVPSDGEVWGVVAAPKGVAYTSGVETGDGGTPDIAVHRVGSGEWTRYWDGAAHGNDKGYDVAMSAAGAVYVAGASGATGDTTRAVLLKYTTGGNRVWVKQWSGIKSAGAVAKRVLVTTDGRIVIAGEAQINGKTHIFAAKYTAAGKRLWLRTYSRGLVVSCLDACLGGDGSLYLAGSYMPDEDTSDAYVARITPAGRIAWVKRTDFTGWNALFRALCPRPAGGVYVTGVLSAQGGGTDSDGVVRKYTATGASKTIALLGAGDGALTSLYDITRATDGRVVVCGDHTHTDASASLSVVASYTDGGTENWYREWTSPTGAARGSLVAACGAGGIVVSGFWERVWPDWHQMTYFVNSAGIRRARNEWAGPSPGGVGTFDISVRGSSTWVAGSCEQLITGTDGFAMRLVP